MKYKITERQLKVVKGHIENNRSLNESGFWSGVKRIFVGKDFEDYAYDLENLLIEISENIYENEDIKQKVIGLYKEIQTSDLDRIDKRELLSIMNNLYNIIERSNQDIKKELRRLQYLGR